MSTKKKVKNNAPQLTEHGHLLDGRVGDLVVLASGLDNIPAGTIGIVTEVSKFDREPYVVFEVGKNAVTSPSLLHWTWLRPVN